MSNEFWDEDSEGFRDIPDEVNGKDAPPVPVDPTAAPVRRKRVTPVEEVVPEETTQEAPEEDDYTEVLSDARLRLEQGRLYEMIMNHNMFDGLEVDQRAAKQVQREIRNYAKERMEIMLGMRQEEAKEDVTVQLPFNGLEIEVLRAMASTFSKGATKSPEAESVAVMPVRQETLKPLASPKKLAPKEMKAVQKTTKALPTRPTTPVKRAKPNTEIDQILAQEGISKELIEEDYVPLNKPLSKMTTDELLARNEQSSKRRQRQVKPKGMRVMSQEEINTIYTSRAHEAAADPKMQTLMHLLLNQKK